MENKYRRFKFKDNKLKEAFESLVANKNLSREDLTLILNAVELNRDIYEQPCQVQ